MHGDGQDTGEWHFLSVAIICIDDPQVLFTGLQDHRTIPHIVSCTKKKKERKKFDLFPVYSNHAFTKCTLFPSKYLKISRRPPATHNENGSTQLLLKIDRPAATHQTALKNPFKQTLLLAAECIPGHRLLYSHTVFKEVTRLHTRCVITSTSRHQITSFGLWGQLLQVGSQTCRQHT